MNNKPVLVYEEHKFQSLFADLNQLYLWILEHNLYELTYFKTTLDFIIFIQGQPNLDTMTPTVYFDALNRLHSVTIKTNYYDPEPDPDPCQRAVDQSLICFTLHQG